jgi:hypothetical protein
MFTETYGGNAWSSLNAKGVADIIQQDKFASRYVEVDWETGYED